VLVHCAVATSNIEILERFQSKALRIIVDAPWYVPNNHIRRDLQMPSVKEEICRYTTNIALVSPHIQKKKKKLKWSESANELYRPSDRRLSPKRLPTFAEGATWSA
jgi:hypothetical protein